MLVDPIFRGSRDKVLMSVLDTISGMQGGSTSMPTRLQEGIYEIHHFNFSSLVRDRNMLPADLREDYEYGLLECRPFYEDWQLDDEGNALPNMHPTTSVSTYGVVDSVENLLESIPSLLTSNNYYCVGLTKIVSASQSPSGGWRWHKWGSYLGKYNPKTEYIYDERDRIPHVYTFSVVRLLPEEIKKSLPMETIPLTEMPKL